MDRPKETARKVKQLYRVILVAKAFDNAYSEWDIYHHIDLFNEINKPQMTMEVKAIIKGEDKNG